jgi:hypothetical protein
MAGSRVQPEPPVAITVNCVDGRCKGLRDMDVDTLHITCSTTGELTPHIYTISDKSTGG